VYSKILQRKWNKNKKALPLTSGFTQAGAQLVRHFVSNSCLRLSSEPLQYPRLREAATTLHEMRGRHQIGTIVKLTADCPLTENYEWEWNFESSEFYNLCAWGQFAITFRKNNEQTIARHYMQRGTLTLCPLKI
jgi:hypothetical protein